ncbi:hypothetical protein PAMC26510_01125 [Caballeronia sordidicola]|uniref:Uncharacterized protein n=1 Tax=Caballeronia sordidicola TaxID=196367 RepID=A0A242MGR7_CABSO|nr:hypothetical protein PAMC26577_29840 [Caballeronia sordidicola]OTP80834.1 hypothetical protein PAMC26510_01125 [Caballeronia sordidicola]
MFLTAPPVGRFAVQNSQRFHCSDGLRLILTCRCLPQAVVL